MQLSFDEATVNVIRYSKKLFYHHLMHQLVIIIQQWALKRDALLSASGFANDNILDAECKQYKHEMTLLKV
jgi:hypothetical protein